MGKSCIQRGGVWTTLAILAGFALTGCDVIAGKEGSGDIVGGTGAGARLGRDYFTSPQDAVPIITRLLTSRDWRRLSEYYDLTGTTIDRMELESGRFFIRTERPAGINPGVPWEYRHPFTPGDTFERVMLTSTPDVYEVTMQVRIAEAGTMTQRGVATFKMRKSGRGYQILPGK